MLVLRTARCQSTPSPRPPPPRAESCPPSSRHPPSYRWRIPESADDVPDDQVDDRSDDQVDNGSDDQVDESGDNDPDDQVDAGKVALLECRVTHLAAHHTVSWLRCPDLSSYLWSWFS